jgi:hypothetical protein
MLIVSEHIISYDNETIVESNNYNYICCLVAYKQVLMMCLKYWISKLLTYYYFISIIVYNEWVFYIPQASCQS